MTTRDHALDLIGSLGATSAWLNRLDRLFAAVRDAADTLPQSAARDDLFAAIESFRLEFYGAEDGSQHPDSVPVPDTPLEDDAVSVSGIADNAVMLVVSYPVDQDAPDKQLDQVHALASSLANTFPDPKPIIMLNPDSKYKLEALDEDQMLALGWRRA